MAQGLHPRRHCRFSPTPAVPPLDDTLLTMMSKTIDDISDIITDIDRHKTGVPVLLRQYLKLGGKMLGFNVDREFSDVLDGLVLVDLL